MNAVKKADIREQDLNEDHLDQEEVEEDEWEKNLPKMLINYYVCTINVY